MQQAATIGSPAAGRAKAPDKAGPRGLTTWRLRGQRLDAGEESDDDGPYQ